MIILLLKRSVLNMYSKILVNLEYNFKIDCIFIGRDESCCLDRFVLDVGYVCGNVCVVDFWKFEIWWF